MKKIPLLFILLLIGTNSLFAQWNRLREEKLLGTRQYKDFHSALYDYESKQEKCFIKLHCDGIILGYEKIGKNKTLSSGSYNRESPYLLFDIDHEMNVYKEKSFATQIKKCSEVIDDPNIICLTHWFATNNNKLSKRYDVYDKMRYASRFNLMVDAVYEYDNIEDYLAEKLSSGKYSHIIVASTGWNNYPEESLQTYNAWIDSMQAAAVADGKTFSPFFVGITWPSLWKVTKTMPNPVSIFNKANDADELGMLHINHLLWKAVVPASKEPAYDIPVVLIGHSLGARIVSRAAYSRKMYNKYKSEKDIDLIVNFQGAYVTDRFTDDKSANIENGIYSIDIPSNAFVATTSSEDRAMAAGRIISKYQNSTTFIGHHDAIKVLQDSKSAVKFIGATLGADGRFAEPLPTKGFIIVDADKMIKMPPEGGISGSHSDIKDKEAGVFLWEMIKKYAKG